VLLLDALHYWVPEKQEFILKKVRRALRPGGRLVLRDAARAESAAHRRVDFWERMATRLGQHQTVEGLHFLTLTELTNTLKRAGFAHWEIKPGTPQDSNILLTAWVEAPQFSPAQTR
jgi:SAM-dependent methyltransferase